MSKSQVFKVKVEFENGIDGEPGHPPLTIAVSRNQDIRSADMAVAHCMAIVGKVDGKDVTRIHHRDQATGEYFSIKATKVSDSPFSIDEAPKLQSIAEAPNVKEEES